jgi:opacity protein-like surface antigen
MRLAAFVGLCLTQAAWFSTVVPAEEFRMATADRTANQPAHPRWSPEVIFEECSDQALFSATADRIAPAAASRMSLVSLKESHSSESIDHELQPVSLECLDMLELGGNSSAVPPPSSSQLRVFIAPYVWVPAMKGSITALGTSADVNLSLGEAFELLGEVNGAAQGHVEIGKGNWTFIMDGMLLRVTDTLPVSRPLFSQVNTDISATILEVTAARRMPGEFFGALAERGTIVEVLGGVRFYEMDNGLVLIPNNPLVPVVPLEQGEEWVDLLTGIRASSQLTQRVKGFVRGDFAGFGIGTSSDLAWNFTTGVDYQHSQSCSVSLGYRVLDIQAGQTSSGREFEFDVRLQGPFMAMLFHF